MAIVKMTLEQLKKSPIDKEELTRINAMPDEAIDTVDIPAPSDNARLVSFFKPRIPLSGYSRE
jgi:hypothetical protein